MFKLYSTNAQMSTKFVHQIVTNFDIGCIGF